jgi:hypothetical protein
LGVSLATKLLLFELEFSRRHLFCGGHVFYLDAVLSKLAGILSGKDGFLFFFDDSNSGVDLSLGGAGEDDFEFCNSIEHFEHVLLEQEDVFSHANDLDNFFV